MKKKSKSLTQLVSFLFLSLQLFCQTETFDILSYTPPKNWKKDAQSGVVNYISADAGTGKICVITFYASLASTGDAQKDFAREWTALVVNPYKAETNPKTEIQTTEDGWKVISAASPIKVDGNDFYILLSVASGFGKSMSFRTTLNDPSFTSQVDALFATMKIDKTKTSTVNNNSPSTAIPEASGSASGGSGKFGSMLYTSPVGWSEQKFPDGVVFKPKDLPTDEHLSIQIMQPMNFSGTIEQALQQSYDEAAAMYNSTKMFYAGEGNYKKTTAKKSFGGWEYMRGNGGIQVENGTPYKTELGLEVIVIRLNNRIERIAMVSSRKNCNLSRYFTSERQLYRNAIDNFLFSLQFSDLNQPPLPAGSAKGSGIVGVWQGISMSTSYGAGIRYDVFTPIFLSNGQAYFGPHFPVEGLDELNTRIPAELHERDWGTYTFTNGEGTLKMPYGNIPMRMEGGKLTITPNQTDHKFYQLPSVDGARFNGTYALSEVNGKIPTITFTNDGKFNDNGAIKVLYHEYVECINPALLPGSGTYEVKNYSIVFKYADGRKIKIAFLGADYDMKNQNPPTLMMSYNEDKMVRQ